MPNTSATGGYLAPENTTALYDGAFDDFLQAVVVGVTGIAGAYVRPRWQEVMPVQPEMAVTWAAVGVYQIEADDNLVVRHFPNGTGQTYPDGYNETQRHEILQAMVSCYGPDAMGLCARVRDGLGIAQNREQLQLAGVTIYSVDPIVSVPELVNNRWLNRADMTFRLRRFVGRKYQVLNLVSAQGSYVADGGALATGADHVNVTPFSVTQEED